VLGERSRPLRPLKAGSWTEDANPSGGLFHFDHLGFRSLRPKYSITNSARIVEASIAAVLIFPSSHPQSAKIQPPAYISLTRTLTLFV
jgi:hypothetical protein